MLSGFDKEVNLSAYTDFLINAKYFSEINFLIENETWWNLPA